MDRINLVRVKILNYWYGPGTEPSKLPCSIKYSLADGVTACHDKAAKSQQCTEDGKRLQLALLRQAECARTLVSQ